MKSKLVGFFGAVGFLLAAATGANAEVFNTLDAWNAATDNNPKFTVTTTGNIGFKFFGVCPYTGEKCKFDKDLDADPTGDSSAATTAAFIDQYADAVIGGNLVKWENVFLNETIRDKSFPDDTKAGTFSTSDGKSYALWSLKFGNNLIALLFDSAVSEITVSGLVSGMSHLDWGSADTIVSAPPDSEVPLPAALPLLASAFGVMGYVGWRRKKSIQMA